MYMCAGTVSLDNIDSDIALEKSYFKHENISFRPSALLKVVEILLVFVYTLGADQALQLP